MVTLENVGRRYVVKQSRHCCRSRGVAGSNTGLGIDHQIISLSLPVVGAPCPFSRVK